MELSPSKLEIESPLSSFKKKFETRNQKIAPAIFVNLCRVYKLKVQVISEFFINGMLGVKLVSIRWVCDLFDCFIIFIKDILKRCF